MTRSNPVSRAKTTAARAHRSSRSVARENRSPPCSIQASASSVPGCPGATGSTSISHICPVRLATTDHAAWSTVPSVTGPAMVDRSTSSPASPIRSRIDPPSQAGPSNVATSPAPPTITPSRGSTISSMPCGWIAPGIWIGSRSQTVRSCPKSDGDGVRGEAPFSASGFVAKPGPFVVIVQPDDQDRGGNLLQYRLMILPSTCPGRPAHPLGEPRCRDVAMPRPTGSAAGGGCRMASADRGRRLRGIPVGVPRTAVPAFRHGPSGRPRSFRCP